MEQRPLCCSCAALSCFCGLVRVLTILDLDEVNVTLKNAEILGSHTALNKTSKINRASPRANRPHQIKEMDSVFWAHDNMNCHTESTKIEKGKYYQLYVRSSTCTTKGSGTSSQKWSGSSLSWYGLCCWMSSEPAPSILQVDLLTLPSLFQESEQKID